MTINYICNGFDKDFYNFDAVVVPVVSSKNGQAVYGFNEWYLEDFCNDFNKIIQRLPMSEFEPDRATTVKSKKTGIYYIFIMIYPPDCNNIMQRKTTIIFDDENYSYCCKKIVKCINNLDVKNILIHPTLNKADFNHNTDSDLLAKTLESNIGRFSKKNIYICVENSRLRDSKVSNALFRMNRGLIVPEKCKRICMKSEMEKSFSYTNNLIKIAEIETVYNKKSVIEQFYEDMNNSSCFFDECINNYPGTASKLAEKAGIDPSTISTIKNHKYNSKTKKAVLSLAIALDLTADDRKRFINSAGFSYPNEEQDYFIEQQLRKKRYNNVREFNEDIWNEHPDFLLGAKSSK